MMVHFERSLEGQASSIKVNRRRQDMQRIDLP